MAKKTKEAFTSIRIKKEPTQKRLKILKAQLGKYEYDEVLNLAFDLLEAKVKKQNE